MTIFRAPFAIASVVVAAACLLSAGCDSASDKSRNAAEPSHTQSSTTSTASVPQSVSTDADAAFAQGVKFHLGEGQPIDLAKAAEWYTKAADAGHIGAVKNLAALYYEGKGVGQSYQKALDLYRRAADAGDVGAMTSLAGMYLDGKGVPQDYQESLRLYRKAADQNYPYAQTGMGLLYRFGWGVKQDLIEAYAWWILAARNGDGFASENLKKLEPQLSTEDREKGRTRSFELGRAASKTTG
jgi:TPR repeat protein